MKNRKQPPENFSFHPFEGLKSLVESRGIALGAATPVRKKEEPPADDDRLFADAMSAVREIREYRQMTVPAKKTSPPARRQPPCDEVPALLRELVSGRARMDLAGTQEYVEWVSEDCRGDITGRLHEGRYSVQDWLDLHGLCFEEAEAEVDHFLRDARMRGHRCIKIIHGRGLRSPKGPVLKDSVIRWLSGRYRKHVIAFATARQCDGGLGAVYVLLK